MEIEHLTDLKVALKKVLELSELDLIECGNGDPIVAPREQWNDGSNTLAIAHMKLLLMTVTMSQSNYLKNMVSKYMRFFQASWHVVVVEHVVCLNHCGVKIFNQSFTLYLLGLQLCQPR